MTQEEKTMFKQWLCLNGGEEGSLYMTFSDEELEQIFLTAIEVYEKNKIKKIGKRKNGACFLAVVDR